ncbi:MAG: hypothetical protein GY822_27960 [Deltaproteobacteria bacterium]|nr:hypothetical protein [Deltaproteobacteria bacterium]
MRIYELEVHQMRVLDPAVEQLLNQAQFFKRFTVRCNAQKTKRGIKPRRKKRRPKTPSPS